MSEGWIAIGGLIFLAMLPACWLGYLLPSFLGVPLAAVAYWMLGASLYKVLPGATQHEFVVFGGYAAAGAGVAAFLGGVQGRAARRDKDAEGKRHSDRYGEGGS